jgi:hypothetical protein
MIFMDYLYTLPNNTTGMDDILVQSALAMHSIIPLFLMFIFFTIWVGGIWRQSIKTGAVDPSLWCVIASISTFLVALLMSVVEGLIPLPSLIIITVVTIFSGVWFFLDRGNQY